MLQNQIGLICAFWNVQFIRKKIIKVIEFLLDFNIEI